MIAALAEKLYPASPGPGVTTGGTASTGSTVDIHALVIAIAVSVVLGLVLIAISYWRRRVA